MSDEVPKTGAWPVDPQVDQEILKERIWVDGCFDFAHHGRPFPNPKFYISNHEVSRLNVNLTM